ncbi:MAG: ATP-binding protein [Candidatus Gracilibacteria bacterium]|nr:ATP-binding protein [Candidatus Gracilibacteria bacterium]
MENAENKDQEVKITITLPTNAYFISGIRDFTLNMVKSSTNFEEKWAYRFQSVIDELCNNAIEYGSAPGSDIRITFQYKKDDYLKISVEDTGTGKNKLNAAGLQKLFNERKTPGYAFTGIRGRGLVKIVGEWSDEIKFEDRPEGGLKISITKFMKDARKSEESLKNSAPQVQQKPATITI